MNQELIEVNFTNSGKPYNKGHSEPKQFRNKASCCDFQVLLYVTLYVTFLMNVAILESIKKRHKEIIDKLKC